ncbi:hypothetical protein [Antiquaquibacter soli]|uniref:PilZ domain-containing protein n=1 Tax=Antiquaquibacter soli TaxID=3064523 RepID=A0ABT9BQ16_9MICO|nr:hypothetical protein [Protaetiibacter sp. WY-16]MDO7881382.1 hypothetical protein [Protaetiibacter sp. WY-16]
MVSDFAYRVPLVVHRGAARLYRFTNVSAEVLRGVTLTLHGSGVMGANAPATLRPGETLEVDIAGRTLARDSILVIRWFRPSGEEYLWRVSF